MAHQLGQERATLQGQSRWALATVMTGREAREGHGRCGDEGSRAASSGSLPGPKKEVP